MLDKFFFFLHGSLSDFTIYQYSVEFVSNVESVGIYVENLNSVPKNRILAYTTQTALSISRIYIKKSQALYISRSEEKFEASHKNVGHAFCLTSFRCKMASNVDKSKTICI